MAKQSTATPAPPPVSKELVEWLERLFPNRLPEDTKVSEKDLWFTAGSARVVLKLRTEMEKQSHNILGD